MPIRHSGEPVEGALGMFGGAPAEKSSLQKRMEKVEDAAIKREILAKFREGERVSDPRTGAIAVVDASAPRGLRPVFKAVNAHNHQGSFTLGVDDLRKSAKGETYTGPEYGKLAGSEDQVAKRRSDRPANPNSRL